MGFVFDERLSDVPLVDGIWHTQSANGGAFTSTATSTVEMIVTEQRDGIRLTVRGPETKATPSPIPQDASFVGITFKLGTYVNGIPVNKLVNGAIDLPGAGRGTFWLYSSAWQFPNFHNADTFVAQLIRQGIIGYDPIVRDVLQGHPVDLSARTVQRRLRRITGLTHGMIHQIDRAHAAATLLRQGVPILEVINRAGYYDQPHLTRSLKQLMGQTPAQIANHRQTE